MAPLRGHELAAWRAFLEAHAAVTKVLERELHAEAGLPLTWYDVLVQLSEAEAGRLRMGELAQAVLLSRSALTRLVDRMQAAGLVERGPVVSDARGSFAVLTSEGAATLRRATPIHLRGVAEHFSRLLSREESGVLRRALQRVAGAATEDR